MKRSGFAVMKRMIGLVKPLAGYMALAVTTGAVGHLCATFLPVVAVWVACDIATGKFAFTLSGAAVALVVIAILRGVLHYVEQTCNHHIASPSQACSGEACRCR